MSMLFNIYMIYIYMNPPANAGDISDMNLTLGWKDHQDGGMATHSSILAWRIPRTVEPGRYSPWDHKESDTAEGT